VNALVRVARRGIVVAAAAALAAGCVSKEALVVQQYTIDPPPHGAVVDRDGAAIVSLARVRVAPPYAGTAFVYRVGAHRIERDPYATFAAPPGWMLTTALGGYLRNADFIRDVVEPGGELPVRMAIEVDANELCADLPDGGAGEAVLALQFHVYAPAAGITPQKEVLRKTYARKRPLARRDADAIADAWNEQLSEIANEFLADIRPLLLPVP
jgi:hypothetical protein